jgi:hypothetical protein
MQWKKANSALCSIFKRHFKPLIFYCFSVRVAGYLQARYCYYSASLITILQLPDFHDLSVWTYVKPSP